MALSNDDGCVIARSYDAKPFIKTGEPYLQIQHTLKPHGIVPNYALYGDMSERVMSLIEAMVPCRPAVNRWCQCRHSGRRAPLVPTVGLGHVVIDDFDEGLDKAFLTDPLQRTERSAACITHRLCGEIPHWELPE